MTNTPVDREKVLELHNKGLSRRAIARELGYADDRSIRRIVNAYIAENGDNIPVDVMKPRTFEAAHDAAPEGFRVRGVSTLVDDEGNVKQQWIKTWETDLFARVEAAARALSAKLPLQEPVPAPDMTEGQLLNLFTLTDCHVGQLSWSRETGEKWDLDIAEDLLVKAFTHLIESAPAAEFAIINQLGDFLHFDSLVPQTPTSHNALDADSRYQKVVEVAVRVLLRITHLALAKHGIVYVYMHEGNHDMAGSVWLRVMMAHIFKNEPRVIVGQSPLPYVAQQHGKTALFFHHGHLAKKANLPLLFAARFPKLWGDTKKRVIHTGHLHHIDEKEYPGVTVTQHPTLAASDAYSARSGFVSERQATCNTYHKEFGEVGRITVIPEMVGYATRRDDL